MKKSRIVPAVLGLPVRQIENNEWQFFLTRRHAPHKQELHNKWQLAGGALEFGESPEKTLARELKEEINVIPKILFPRPMVKTTVWRGGDDDVNYDIQIILICYIVALGKQEPKNIDPDQETNGLAWLNYQEVLKLDCLPNTKEFIKEAKKILTKPLFDK